MRWAVGAMLLLAGCAAHHPVAPKVVPAAGAPASSPQFPSIALRDAADSYIFGPNSTADGIRTVTGMLHRMNAAVALAGRRPSHRHVREARAAVTTLRDWLAIH